MLHANELLLRHLFHHVDGDTSGPREFTGPIGKQLKKCDKLPVVQFKPSEGNLGKVPENIVKDFSTDQNYLFEVCQVITSGHCNTPLSNRNPGKLAHSRWATTANRILRLYISSENPSLSLMKLTEFIMNVYAPIWFSIKSQPTCNYGAKHLLKFIRLSRYLEKGLRDIVDPVIQRNGFFGHHENIILSMISDERKHRQKLGLRRILKAKSVLPRKTKNDFINNPKSSHRINFEKYPCHTQCAERCVKLVTEASAAVCGPDSRDGFIRVRADSRKNMPCFNTKSEFVIKK
ncbi:hypothetical protein RN001_013342 [Aquatica leii]|uniref:Uncharacterized protein n=1 Tax=Aquatica leii TaxID=1421715 RepID=A0AAN7PRM9_9COLE|nr:hypothetical protein RN001_013342 [Aquatica leii]